MVSQYLEYALKLVEQITSMGELTILNKAVIHRGRNLKAITVQEKTNSGTFRVGKKVWFSSQRAGVVHSIIQKINSKSITVEANSGMIWRVSPQCVMSEVSEGK